VIAKNFSGTSMSHGTLAGLHTPLGWIAAAVNAVIQVGSAVMQKKQTDKEFSLQKKTLAAQDAQLAKDRASQLQLALLEINQKRAANGLGPVDINGNLIPSQALATPAVLAPAASAAGIDFKAAAPWIAGAGVGLIALFLVMRGK
jgi:hypothetical protein